MSEGLGSAGAPALQRTVHGFGALMITLSFLSPTIGTFVVGSDVIKQAGSAVFLCFVAAVLLGVAMANVYAELISAYPETGGEYTILGRVLGPDWGFAVLGINLVGLTIALALTALGISSYLGVLIPGLSPVPTAIVVILIVTGIATLNIEINAVITGTFLAVEVASLVALAMLGFIDPQRPVAEAFQPVMANGLGQLVPVSIAIMGTAAAGAIYAFNGYASVVFIGEEVHDAPKRVARVIFAALGIAGVLQVLPMLAIVVGSPDLHAVLSADAPISAFIAATGGPWMSTVMSLAVVIAIFNTMIVVALIAGRSLYSTGRDRVWHDRLNGQITRIHPRFGSPWVATVTMGAMGLLWCFVPLSVLVTIVASGTVAIYSGLCIAAIVGRRSGKTRHAGYRMPLFPLAPVTALLALFGVVWTSLGDAAVGRPGLIATGAIILASAGYYRLVLHGKGNWAHRGPTVLDD